ncbi:MAG: (Na+)-NQR maturation NqrM [Nannocystales bacterium]
MLAAASFAVTAGLTMGLVALLMAGMAIGVIVSNRKLAGSCGGADADCICEKKERGECPHDEPDVLPPNERLVSPNLNRAL